jgi:hypothetical protein
MPASLRAPARFVNGRRGRRLFHRSPAHDLGPHGRDLAALVARMHFFCRSASMPLARLLFRLLRRWM